MNSIPIPWEKILHHYSVYDYKKRWPSGDIILRCRVHQERTASLRLYVNSERGKCYGCGWMPTKHDFIRKLSGSYIPWEILNPNSYFYPDDQLLFDFMEEFNFL
jgi:hypothetical protein